MSDQRPLSSRPTTAEDRRLGPAPFHGNRFDAIAIVGLVLVLAARWWHIVFARQPLIDEAIYLRAFASVLAGGSPYEVEAYYYPPVFAQVGAYLLRLVGEGWVIFLLRFLVLVFLSVAVWLSLTWWPSSRPHRFFIAAVYLSLAPAVSLSLVFGNVSFVVIGLVLVALTLWQIRPWMAGIFLGLSVGIKPLAPMAILALGAHRPRPEGKAQWIAAGAATLIMATVLLPPARLLEMASQPIAGHNYFRTISLHRILSLAGMEISPLGVAILVAVITVIVCRLVSMSVEEILSVATTASVLAAPVIWAHTFVLVLPLQVIAFQRAWARRASPTPLRRYELWFVILAIAALQFSKGAGLVDLMPAPYQIVTLAVPYLAAPALATYVLVSRQS